jgi:phosphoribosylanthranilate isomerase
MSKALQVKVCGLTSLADAEFAAASGADHLGFILHPKSPRHIALGKYRGFSGRLPKRTLVAVTVEPGPDELLAMREAGFERFQVHFRHETPISVIESWSSAVGAENLWLAPKLPPGADATDAWLGLSRTVLLDTFDEKLFGGTGRTGDWPKFRRHQDGRPATTWILSGGLNPANVAEAIVASGARFVDVNSGVESSPGVKDHAKVKAFFAAAAKAAGARNS